MKDEILETFGVNIGRVKNLLTIYTEWTGEGKGRRGVEDTDLLRATVVFLHATLEEFLRGIEQWKLPSAPAARLDTVPLKGTKGAKFFLGGLHGFKGQSVNDVIASSIEEHLDRSNYNNLPDVTAVLDLVPINDATVDALKADLDDAMKRRHKIVHQADRNVVRGRGAGPAAAIDRPTVAEWVSRVENFVNEVAKHL